MFNTKVTHSIESPVMGAVPGEEGERETRFLRYIAKAHRKARETLLLHPLTQAYIHVKWDAVSILFNLLTIVYVIREFMI